MNFYTKKGTSKQAENGSTIFKMIFYLQKGLKDMRESFFKYEIFLFGVKYFNVKMLIINMKISELVFEKKLLIWLTFY